MAGETAQTGGECAPAPSSIGDGAACPDDAFDRNLLLHLVQHGAREAMSSGSSIESALGVTAEQLEIIAAFAGLKAADWAAIRGVPAPDDEQLMLRELLMRYRSQSGQIGEWLACIVARRSMEPNHLWEDLGLPERPDLTRLLMRHFQPLAANNTRNMRWKRFLYRAICESEGFSMCPSPTCDACSEFHICYSDESGPSALARNGHASEPLIVE